MEKYSYQNSNKEEDIINQDAQVNFQSLFEIFLRRKKILILLSFTFFLIAFSNLIYRRINKPIFQGSFTLMISDPFIGNRTKNSDIEDLALNKELLDIPTLVQYLRSPGVLSSIAKKYSVSPNNLSNRIKITVPRSEGSLGGYLSKTLLISLEGENKLIMQNILNDLSKQYVINASESRNEKLIEGINFLENEKPKILLKVEKAQAKLEKFRLKNQILDPIKEGGLISSLIEDHENKILTLQSENKRLIFIKSNLVNGILYTEGISNSNSSDGSTGLGVISPDQLLLQEILNVKSALANAQSKYKKSSIVIKNLNEKLSQLEPILLKNQKLAVDAAIVVNNSLIKSYENQLIELKKKFLPIPNKITEYAVINQELISLEKNLQTLSETKDKLELDLSQGILPWKILVDPFVNPYPVKPELKRNFIYILLGSLVLSSLITLLIEKLDDVFHNPKEVEKFINLPVLGFVPFFAFNKQDENENKDPVIKISEIIKNKENSLFKSTKFIFEETFRNIYTSIKFSKSEKAIKIINITSTIPEEGKSLCSLFLAINISQISKKVLIVDSDLRRPSLHKRLEVDNVSGISNYLVSNDSDWSKYITKHDSCENLSYITAGKIPPNSITLLESKKMKSFIEELRKSNQFDFIILDCPPVLGLSDSMIISSYVDASILTVSLKRVNKKLAVECLKKFMQIKTPIIGSIINCTSEDAANSNLLSGNYSYGNPYNYYSYKYMPSETQNRYSDLDDELKFKGKLFDKLFVKKTLMEKLKFIFSNFRKWLDE